MVVRDGIFSFLKHGMKLGHDSWHNFRDYIYVRREAFERKTHIPYIKFHTSHLDFGEERRLKKIIQEASVEAIQDYFPSFSKLKFSIMYYQSNLCFL